jgi:Cytochrome P450
MRFITEDPGLQHRLRADPSLIPDFLEEVLRLEGSTKMTARLVRKDTQIGELKVPAGTKVMLALSAANRDPRRFENPQELILGRPKIREHLAFSRGAHVCIGAPLARVEVRIILEKLLALTSEIDLLEQKHGPRGNRTLDYEPSFIIRGLSELHLTLTPAAGQEAGKPSEARSKGIFGSGRNSESSVSGATGYSTAGTKLGTLLADPAAKAVLDKYFPGVSADPRIGMAKSMTLRAVQKFAPDLFKEAALDAADAELAQLRVH